MSRPDDELDPIIERAETLEEWVGVRQGADEDRDTDRQELERLRAIVAAVEHWADSRICEWSCDEELRHVINEAAA